MKDDKRIYLEYSMHECLAIITEEVGFSGDSFGWSGDIPIPLGEELAKRGIMYHGDLFGTWGKDPDYVGNPDDIPFLVHKAVDEYRGGRTEELSKEELKAWGDSSFKLGNHKLGKDTIVFNITSGHDCPARDQCDVRDNCYAVADEKLWGTPLAYRRRQTAFWDMVNAEYFASAMPIPNYFRFSEAGDFRHQADVDKMRDIAFFSQPGECNRGLIVYGYTNRKDLDFGELMKYAVVNGHGFMLSNKVVIKDKPEPGDNICPGDCRDCDWCKVSRGMVIVFPKRKR